MILNEGKPEQVSVNLSWECTDTHVYLSLGDIVVAKIKRINESEFQVLHVCGKDYRCVHGTINHTADFVLGIIRSL